LISFRSFATGKPPVVIDKSGEHKIDTATRRKTERVEVVLCADDACEAIFINHAEDAEEIVAVSVRWWIGLVRAPALGAGQEVVTKLRSEMLK
jgi:hypothetical protein